MRCTVYAQISRFKLKAKVSLMSPQWGKCSKVSDCLFTVVLSTFQSPQWGKCSKDKNTTTFGVNMRGFSPRNGESVLKKS